MDVSLTCIGGKLIQTHRHKIPFLYTQYYGGTIFPSYKPNKTNKKPNKTNKTSLSTFIIKFNPFWCLTSGSRLYNFTFFCLIQSNFSFYKLFSWNGYSTHTLARGNHSYMCLYTSRDMHTNKMHLHKNIICIKLYACISLQQCTEEMFYKLKFTYT